MKKCLNVDYILVCKADNTNLAGMQIGVIFDLPMELAKKKWMKKREGKGVCVAVI